MKNFKLRRLCQRSNVLHSGDYNFMKTKNFKKVFIIRYDGSITFSPVYDVILNESSVGVLRWTSILGFKCTECFYKTVHPRYYEGFFIDINIDLKRNISNK